MHDNKQIEVALKMKKQKYLGSGFKYEGASGKVTAPLVELRSLFPSEKNGLF